ncbi:MAG: class I SAM-dependent methyltransferase [Ezakiella sp.]|nr:class I SAM-dependent methyltransferase [Ezakiella sp.]MDD7471986.1 class I SAM-dependent methyltransferase [Bacillota bacterium]MDY3923950.1 class I SAM-dependent methyltransferase [Ezakiella sp.]
MDRLETIIELAKKYNSIADIGCDHGQVGLVLVKNKLVNKMISADISLKCLNKSKDLFKINGLVDYYDGRVGDGLAPINDAEVETVIIAGMGGDLVCNIVRANEAKTKSFKNFIIQPMTNPDVVRKCFYELGYGVKKDLMVVEGDKYYFLIEFSRENERKAESDWYYTSTLLRDGGEKYANFIEHSIEENANIMEIIAKNGKEKSKKKIDALKIKNKKLEKILGDIKC